MQLEIDQNNPDYYFNLAILSTANKIDEAIKLI